MGLMEGSEVRVRGGDPAATTPEPKGGAPEHGMRASLLTVGLVAMRTGPVLMLVVVVVVLASLTSVFLTERNLQNLAMQSSFLAVLAIGQLMVILTRGADLSVGSAMSLASVLGASAFDRGASGVVVILIMLATGLGIGAINALVIVKMQLANPIIVTLAMLGIVSGAALVIADGMPNQGMPETVVTLGSHYVGPIPIPAIIVVVVAFVAWVFTTRVRWGRWIYAVGGNPEASSRVGIPQGRVLTSVYLFSGLMAGVAAVLISGRTVSGYPTAGSQQELIAITAVIVGGASFYGGRGSVPSCVVGALILGAIANGLNLLSVEAYYQVIATGVVLIVAVGLDVVRTRLETLFRSEQGRLHA